MNPLRQTNRRGTLLASPIQTPSSHDALLVVDLSNPSYRSLGRFIRTGSTLVAAPELHPGAGCHYRHHRLAQVTSALLLIVLVVVLEKRFTQAQHF